MSNDLISRSALLERLRGVLDMVENEPVQTYANAIRATMRDVRLAPAVDVPVLHVDAIPVRGEWDYSGNVPDEDNNIQCRCTNCNAGDKHAVSMMYKVPFCWRCGAKMYKEGKNA